MLNPSKPGTHRRRTLAVALAFCLIPMVASANSQIRASDSPPSPDEVRSIDGSGNNLSRDRMGAAGEQLARWSWPRYGDNIASLNEAGRPSPRAVSNAVHAQVAERPNRFGLSDLFWQWGQFVDHDLDLTETAHPTEPAPIAVPIGDPWFDPQSRGNMTIPLSRSAYDPDTGTGKGNPRHQINQISAWIDASNVYGSDEARATALRRLDGSGKLKTSAGDLLPFNTEGLPNAGGTSPQLFLAGDIRANEQLGLAAMHTLFVREHNRLADEIALAHADWTDEQIYQQARRIVGAQMQVITYEEFLPLLLGPGALEPYWGYRPDGSGWIHNEFSTAAFRLGHTLLSPILLRLNADGEPIAQGHVSLVDAFFSPQRLVTEGGIEPLLRGLTRQVCQDVDVEIIDEVRNFLFGPPGSGGLDLPALNIQRGRDHGLNAYNKIRTAVGLSALSGFADFPAAPGVAERLASVYASVNAVDAWTGMLAEQPPAGRVLGETMHRIVKYQFEKLRAADRFWYQHALPADLRAEVAATRLRDIILRNTSIGDDELAEDIWHAAE